MKIVTYLLKSLDFVKSTTLRNESFPLSLDFLNAANVFGGGYERYLSKSSKYQTVLTSKMC